MARLTPISWKKFDKFLLFVGCIFKHQKGSHRVYTQAGLKRPLVVPSYGEIPIFIIRNNLKLMNMTVEQYLEIIKNL
jgi:predicted RNA binding protein YcfA (HicA-like mRNA interferase family)